MRDKKAWLLLTNRSLSLVWSSIYLLNNYCHGSHEFVLVNNLFALSLRFSDDEDLLQREREKMLESWKAGVL